MLHAYWIAVAVCDCNNYDGEDTAGALHWQLSVTFSGSVGKLACTQRGGVGAEDVAREDPVEGLEMCTGEGRRGTG